MKASEATPRRAAAAGGGGTGDGGDGSGPLMMTPQLREAIALLTKSRLELEAEIAKECDANPILAVEG